MRPTTRLALVAAFALAACAKQLAAPTAVAAADKTQVAVGAVVSLTAKDSADPNTPAQPLFYHWAFKELPPGSHAAINDPTIVNPSFVADVEGAYTVTLVVQAGKLASKAAEVSVTAGPCGHHAPAVSEVKASPDKPGRGQAVLLTATVADADIGGDCNLAESLSYDWRILQLPPGSAAKLNLPDALTPSFVVDAVGDYVVQLVVRDSTGLVSEAKTLTISAKVCGSNAPSVEAPVAAPAAPGVGETVQLSAKATDADDEEACAANQTLAYHWYFVSLPAGSTAKLNDADVEKPSFVPDVAGDYVIRAKVSDGTGLDTVSPPLVLAASACGGAAPAIAAISAEPAQPNSGQTVQLTADVTDADADAACGKTQSFSYAWRLVALPAGSHAKLNDGGATNPSFVADLPGTYTAELVVTDQSGLKSTATSFSFQASTCGNALPTAEIAVPDNAAIGSLVNLTATVSDADTDSACGKAASYGYAWSFAAIPAGSSATLNDAGVQAPSFTADRAGTYTLRLVVTDPEGHASLPAFADLTVSPCGGNAPSATIAATPEAPGTGALVQLAATATDADNDAATCNGSQTFTFAWRFVSVPAGSTAVIQNPTLAAPYFTADLPGDYALALVVTDSTGRSSEATSTVTVSACGAAAPEANPTASSTSPGIGQSVLLTAAATDADNDTDCAAGQTFTWAWTFDALPAGSKAALNAPTAAQPSFTPDVSGTYTVRLVATDSTGRRSAGATLDIVASGCGAALPVASAAASTSSPNVGQSVLLTASATDADNAAGCAAGQTVSYQWAFDALPAGSTVSLNAPGATSPSFTPDLPGSYVLRLVATDSTGRQSKPATLTVTASSCGAAAPTVTADTTTPTQATGQAVLLRATATDADNQGSCGLAQTLSYAWSLDSLPAGSKATLNAAGAVTPSFVPDVPGTYVARVVVTDSTGRRSAPATVTVIADTCGVNRPSATIAQTPASVGAGMAVQLTPTVTDADNGATCQAKASPTPVQTFAFQWTLLSAPTGSTATILNAGARDAGFLADRPGTYLAQLVVTDSTGLASAPATITVTADTCGANAPTATVSTDKPSPALGQVMALTAVVDDADNGATCQAILGTKQVLTYEWKVTKAPAGSSVRVTNAASPVASFAPDVAGDYTLEFTAFDQTRLSVTKQLAFTAVQCGMNVPAVAPSVDASSSATVNGLVLLRSNATDPDVACGAASAFTSYRWTLLEAPAGSRANLLQGVKDTSFVPDVAGTYVASVEVTDQSGLRSAPGYVTVTVSACGGNKPVARISGPTSILAGQVAQFDALGTTPSTDADNAAACGMSQQLTFRWELFSSPAGSFAGLQPTQAVSNPWINPTVKGPYVVRLKVTDSTGLSSDWAQFTLNVQ